ncbi:MAG: ABC transporter ATP-binding protein [Clostridiales bacterium]|jgi:spermidine/putrescine transport system ATP-binding protein|nr:ABC transporter ATP-binding protein [Clostridiales bacterium]
MDALLRIDSIKKKHHGVNILNNLSLCVRNKEFVSVLGPSGCGKTTLLRIISGFETPDFGDILFDNKSILKLPAYRRCLNTVFQRYALFPHMNVFENIAFGLKIKKFSKSAIEKKVKDILLMINMTGYENRNVNSLSGGQQQRVAIARALINEPKVLLLDEPLAALDLKLRKEMQTELKNMQRKLNITFIYVTHDQEEALSMSDTIAVINDGIIQQIGTPEDIYNEPKNIFVADFIGESNLINGIMKSDGLVNFAGFDFVCIDRNFNSNEEVDIVIRPEDIELIEPSENKITGIVTDITFRGVHFEIIVRDKNRYLWTIHSTIARKKQSRVSLRILPDLIHVMKKQK